MSFKKDTRVICDKCGNSDWVSFAQCLREGWPKCHRLTMRLDITEADIEDDIAKLVDEAKKN